jgi:serine/threonine protein kinase
MNQSARSSRCDEPNQFLPQKVENTPVKTKHRRGFLQSVADAVGTGLACGAWPIGAAELVEADCQALVAKHLDQHGNDPQRSMAALSSLGEVREQLLSTGDDQVTQTLSMMTVELQKDDVAAPSWTAGDATSGGQRFRVVKFHKRGGLGEVFVAYDRELNREVALKEIQRSHANNPESQARFTLEAEITGGLEHPGIVPVYGLGHYGDGRPFYAMRFIRGENLKTAIEDFHRRAASRSAGENSLEFRQLLRRFLDVCRAIEYAHSRGVLHRDIKPGNIMLGKYGETLVVDWGLARASGRDEKHRGTPDETTLVPRLSGSGSEKTAIGQAMGTPAFMSPEQASGRWDELGPATDVYGLGATLYVLLTGQSPFRGNRSDVLQAQVANHVGSRRLRIVRAFYKGRFSDDFQSPTRPLLNGCYRLPFHSVLGELAILVPQNAHYHDGSRRFTIETLKEEKKLVRLVRLSQYKSLQRATANRDDVHVRGDFALLDRGCFSFCHDRNSCKCEETQDMPVNRSTLFKGPPAVCQGFSPRELWNLRLPGGG